MDAILGVAMLVVFISDKKRPGKNDFKVIESKGHVWGYTDRKTPIEFIMPVRGTLRFQQNRGGYYDVTQGALRVAVTVSLSSKK